MALIATDTASLELPVNPTGITVEGQTCTEPERTKLHLEKPNQLQWLPFLEPDPAGGLLPKFSLSFPLLSSPCS